METKKDKSIAIILALFLGGLGIHKFYLREPNAGILYIFLFLLCFASVLISFIDCLILLFMSDIEFNRKYNTPKPQYTSQTGLSNNLDNLNKLHQLKEKGVISDEEFNKAKSKLI